MDPALCNDYKVVRDVILKEHKSSLGAYLDFFNKLLLLLLLLLLLSVQLYSALSLVFITNP